MGTLLGSTVACATLSDNNGHGPQLPSSSIRDRCPEVDCAGSTRSSTETLFAAALIRGFVEWDAPERLGLPLRAWILLPSAPSGHPAQANPERNKWLILFEADGAGWSSGGRVPPSDPTPQRPSVLPLALATRHNGPILYLGRPCQFKSVPGSAAPNDALDKPKSDRHAIWNKSCATSRLWTSHRFSGQVVEGYRQLLELLLHQRPAGATGAWIFAGFSGGGTLAALVAVSSAKGVQSPRACLITLAAPLDLETWTQGSGLSRLAGSIDPADDPAALSAIPGAFLYGADDRQVGWETFGRLQSNSQLSGRLSIIRGYSHRSDWSKPLDASIRRYCSNISPEHGRDIPSPQDSKS